MANLKYRIVVEWDASDPENQRRINKIEDMKTKTDKNLTDIIKDAIDNMEDK